MMSPSENGGHCADHSHQRERIEKVYECIAKIRAEFMEKYGKVYGWQKAQAFFIGLCFTCLIGFAYQVNTTVEKVGVYVSKIDKQMTTIIASNAEFKRSTRDALLRLDTDVRFCKKEISRIKQNQRKGN